MNVVSHKSCEPQNWRHHWCGNIRVDRHAAAANAGPAITVSFTLGAIAGGFAGLCYAEMASTVPIAGGAYTCAYATMGEFVAWIIGWDLEYALGATTVAIGIDGA